MTSLRPLSRLAPIFVLGLALATPAFSASIAFSQVHTGFGNQSHALMQCGVGVICGDAFGSSQATAQADYGALRVFTTAGPGSGAFASADAYASVDFQLFSPNNGPITILVGMAYHYSVNNADAGNQIMSCLNCPAWAQIRVSDSPGLFNDNCPENQGANYGIVDCAGAHTGVLPASIVIQSGAVSTLAYQLNALSIGGLVDGFNTAYISSIVVPDGVTWQYTDLPGNPLNFQNQTSGTGVPEPAAAWLMSLGFGAVIFGRMRWNGRL